MTKIVKFLKPYMGATVAALFFSLFNNLMQLILPAMMALMINTGIGDGRMGTVQLIGGVMAALSAIAIGAAIAGSYYSSKVSACFGLSLRRALFVKVESLSQCDIDKIGTPSLITRTTNDIRQIQDMILMMIRIIISAPIVMVGGAFMAFTMSLDDFVISYFVTGSSFITLPVEIYNYTKKPIQPKIYALFTLMFIVILVLMVVMNLLQAKSEKNRQQPRRARV